MKKLLLIIFLFVSFQSFSQVGSKIVLFKLSLDDTLTDLRWYNNDLYLNTSADSILFNKPTNVSVDTTAGDANIATHYFVRTTDSVGTLVSGSIGAGFTAIDTARTNAVSNVTAGTGVTITTEAKTKKIAANLSTGISGGQSVIGGTASGDSLVIYSTSNATKGKIKLGSSAYDEVNNRLGIGYRTPATELHIDKGNATASALKFTAGTTTGQTSTDGFNLGITTAGAAELRNYETNNIVLYNGNSSTVRVGDSVSNAFLEIRRGGLGSATAIASAASATGFAINRNPYTGAIYNSSHYGFQFTQQGNGMEVQRYSGAGAFAGYAWVVDQNSAYPRIGYNILAPMAQVHQQAGNGVATSHKFTAGTTTGATATDGFEVGITSSAHAEIRQFENLDINIYTNNTLRATWENSGMLLFAAGSATAGTAPIKLTTGTVNTVAEAGAIEYATPDFFLTNGTAVRYNVDKSLTGSATLDFGSTATLTSADLTITVTGAALNDVVNLGVPNGSVNANSCYTAWVSATNTVTVRFNNYSAGSIDPASGTFKVRVNQ